MFTRLTNMIGKIKNALYGLKLNARAFFRRNSHREMFVLLITCVSGNILLQTMSDIDQVLLQFIDFTNLLDLLLHFSPSFVVKWVQIHELDAKGLVK